MKRTSIRTSESNLNRLLILVFEICLLLLFLYQSNVTFALERAANESVSDASDATHKSVGGNSKSGESHASKSDKKGASKDSVSKSNPANPSSIPQGHPLYEVSKAAEEIRMYVNTKVNKQTSKESLTNHLDRLYSEIAKAAQLFDKDQAKKMVQQLPSTDKIIGKQEMLNSGKPESNVLVWLTFLCSLVAALLIFALLVSGPGRVRLGRSRDEGEKQYRDNSSDLRNTVSDIQWDIKNIKELLRNIGSRINEFGPSINSKKIEQKVTPSDQQMMHRKERQGLASGRRSTVEEMSELYNAQSEDDFRTRYEDIRVLGVLNSSARKDNSYITPIFDTDSSPSLWGIQSEGDKMIVFPRMGIDLNSAPNILAYAIDAIYCWNGNPTNNYRITEPAIFVKSGNGWKVEKKGKIEFY